MSRYRVVACGALASVFVWTGQASAGWVIDGGRQGGKPINPGRGVPAPGRIHKENAPRHDGALNE